MLPPKETNSIDRVRSREVFEARSSFEDVNNDVNTETTKRRVSFASLLDDSTHSYDGRNDMDVESGKGNKGKDSGFASGNNSGSKSGNNSGFKSLLNTHTFLHAIKWTSEHKEFIQEMKLMSKLRHPNIITVMGAVLDNIHEPMLVMEYMSHGSLRDLLNNQTMELAGETLLPVLIDIAQGMNFLHSASPAIVHW